MGGAGYGNHDPSRPGEGKGPREDPAQPGEKVPGGASPSPAKPTPSPVPDPASPEPQGDEVDPMTG